MLYQWRHGFSHGVDGVCAHGVAAVHQQVDHQPGVVVRRDADLEIATPAAEQHYWLDADAMVELSGRKDDQQWVAGFWDMLAKVEAYGYSDMEKKQVKAHVDLARC